MREHRWTDARLSPYIDREMSESERLRVEAHASICPQCRRMLATLRRMLEGLRDLSRGSSPPSDLADSVIERLRGQG